MEHVRTTHAVSIKQNREESNVETMIAIMMLLFDCNDWSSGGNWAWTN